MKSAAPVDPVSAHVGGVLRAARKGKGQTLDGVATAIGVCRAMLQKYETGTNRISVPVLVQAMTVLELTPADVFGGLEQLHRKAA